MPSRTLSPFKPQLPGQVWLQVALPTGGPKLHFTALPMADREQDQHLHRSSKVGGREPTDTANPRANKPQHPSLPTPGLLPKEGALAELSRKEEFIGCGTAKN